MGVHGDHRNQRRHLLSEPGRDAQPRPVRRDGKPVAALIDARLFERIRRMQQRFDALCDRLEQTYTGVSADEALAEIARATTRAR